MRGIGVGMVFSAILFSVSSKNTMSDEQIKEQAKRLGMVEAESPDSISQGIPLGTATPVPTNEATKMAEQGITPEPAKEPDENNNTTNAGSDGAGKDSTGESNSDNTVTGDNNGDINTEDGNIKDTNTEEGGSTAEGGNTAESGNTTEGGNTSEGSNTTGNSTQNNGNEDISANPVPTEAVADASPIPTQSTDIGGTTADGKAVVVIKEGMHSEDVAKLMYDAGIVEDAKDFDLYLKRNGYATRIKYGVFAFKKGTPYEDIAERITQTY